MFLNICSKVDEFSKKNSPQDLKGILLKTLAKSLSEQKEIETYLDTKEFKTDEERMIGRLHWHKKHNSLPKGLSDPEDGLLPENLQEKLDEALEKRINGLLKKRLEPITPQSLKKGLLGCVYELEGKDVLMQLLTYLVTEFGVKQLSDPHLFAQAILYANGVEVMDYELDGFGRNKEIDVVEVGEKILESLQKGESSESIISLFNKSKLIQAPGGVEAIQQKQEVKKHLKEYINSLLIEMIGEEAPRSESDENSFLNYAKKVSGSSKVSYATVAKQTLQHTIFPCVGAASVSLYLLIDGMLFFTNHLNTLHSIINYKKTLPNHLADRIVELVYHPSWRIILLQMIDTISEQDSNSNRSIISKKDFDTISDFFIQHLLHDISFKSQLSSVFQYFKGDEAFKLFRKHINSSSGSFVENAVKSLIPTCKEITLYCRVVDAFRKRGIAFKGDEKFWEVFIRESLNQLVGKEVRISKDLLPNAEKISIREREVDQLLECDENKLFAKLFEIEISQVKTFEME